MTKLGRLAAQASSANAKLFIQNVAEKVCPALFIQQYNSHKTDLDQSTGRPVSGKSHNGDAIRAAYHGTLHHLHLHLSENQFATIIGTSNNPRPIEHKARLYHALREQTRMAAWQHMDAVDSIELLRKRNMEKHGREEGPSFEGLVEKYCSHGLSEEGAHCKICQGGLYKTSETYDQDFGIILIPIHVHPEGPETHEMRKQRLDTEQGEQEDTEQGEQADTEPPTKPAI